MNGSSKYTKIKMTMSEKKFAVMCGKRKQKKSLVRLIANAKKDVACVEQRTNHH